jgi:esterase/lipase superfamily enzyme
MKRIVRWQSPRVHREVSLVRWGDSGTPVLFFPTAGGDAEEIERFRLVDALKALIDERRICLFSVDSVSGSAWLMEEGTIEHRMWLQNEYHHFIRHEVVPAIRTSLDRPDATIVSAGASLGAFHAAAVLCRYPDAFERALCLSGTFDLQRVFRLRQTTLDHYYSSPLDFVAGLQEQQLAPLRDRFVQFAAGQGRAENISDSLRLAGVLGKQGIPNRVDNWGPQAHHDWPLWRTLAPKYLGEWI